eukprot:CAMPEP_0205905640 /NCGR_PEP_ID=MMETSP1325-20131115/1470_1 /ASSEMBLY_ACC=CAM_ASM_000708 /TAXON_ID=236786 /ORGANISM="Florenciella sp., Strain RCC1007" /LENGTH=115 /DNA_ID=CAMNT_0053271565 /DNA_START=90 /DNA_END=437 /DNA_ORIENTATION=+
MYPRMKCASPPNSTYYDTSSATSPGSGCLQHRCLWANPIQCPNNFSNTHAVNEEECSVFLVRLGAALLTRHDLPTPTSFVVVRALPAVGSDAWYEGAVAIVEHRARLAPRRTERH